ncbi:MAG: alpha-amylase family glycosyl hydrolase [Bacteroidales bacterium]|jgi:glycosidase
MKKVFLALFLMVSGLSGSYAQLITADPAFPTDQDQVTIVFNAQLGSGGLAGTSDDVYAHTGVITNLSSSSTDWKYVKADWTTNIPECKLSPVGDDLWQLIIGPSIRDYYGVPANETILKLAFVFRNSDGSATGKTEDGGDIFYDVSVGGTNVLIGLPSERPTVVQLNDQVEVSGNSNDADSTFVYVDNVQIYAGTGATFFTAFVADSYGKHWVKAVAKGPVSTAADSLYVYVRKPAIIEDRPAGMVDGINYIDDNTVILSLYAPEKEFVFAVGDFSDWELEESNEMKITPDGKRFWVELINLEAGKPYIFQYLIDGTIRVGDIYADQVSDPWNDQYITNATYPNLIDYPAGKTTGIATVFQTAQSPYQWQINSFTTPDPNKLVVYELLVRDFTTDHTFNSTLDTLDYLEKLGVTAIELMPVSEFEGNLSWGYNPNYYFAVDKYYGPKDTFKAFVDECHSRGIAVIMDIVLNHAYGTCPLAMMYWDGENNRPAANNPWFNVTSPNPTYSWGSDFNHESQATKDFVDRVNKYWLEEYKIDGFRFDFTKGFTNKPGDGGAYDQSRIDILKRMATQIWTVKSDALVILEHFADNSEEKVLANNGILIWGNMNNAYCQADMGYASESDFSQISYVKRGWSQPNVVGYMESHDEERVMYKNLTWGLADGNYSVKNPATALSRVEAAATFFIPVPGPKMIWQFGELGYDYSINTCEDGSINTDCRVSPKPIKWSYYNEANRKRVYNVYKALIEIKKNEPAFSTSDFTIEGGNSLLKTIHLNHTSMNVTIVGNFDVVAGSVVPAFQQAGIWYDFFSSDSIDVVNVNDPILLQPGEYHLYTTKKLNVGSYLDVNENLFDQTRLQLFPNPAGEKLHVSTTLPMKQVELYDMVGKLLKVIPADRTSEVVVNTQSLQNGLYIICARMSDGTADTRKFVRN